MRFLLLLLTGIIAASSQTRPLIVISIDGLDHRYLRDAGPLGLKIPTLRKMMSEGERSEGLVGAVPTVTWPSHTTMITGVPPRVHGILNNRRPASDTGDYYWMADMLRVKTLWHATRKAGLKSAAITWPVTVNADIDFNLPEYFRGRQGGSMDYISIFEKATPGLIEEIERFDPSFHQDWVDDRTRKIATVFLLKNKKPDLLLLHLVDLDAVAHEHGPFGKEAHEALERIDSYLAEILAVVPRNAVVAVHGDHGFERIDQELSIPAFARQLNAKTKLISIGGLLASSDQATADAMRASKELGREVPNRELLHFAPEAAKQGIVAAFEPKRHQAFTNTASQSLHMPPHERGNHGFWPGLEDYRAAFLLWGAGIDPALQPAAPMESAAERFAGILGVTLER
ncbi:ectonucleotide pyrophosphatase/phosphodiesterase [Bryobacter aggregatus]|uniref:alkaline phosphatase family protein n=1 Tax=Bryobacter aggregatus TaxID=360054 RepID=UPI0004E141A6|nr:ectonucleotide pyrophosphatase/phosphodiesterase [Bryobacter aggregatus]